jgi:tetratricopeptide (TPR) repeat protein
MTQGKLVKLAMRYYEQLIDQIEVVQDESDAWEATTHYAGALLMRERDLLKEALKEINRALKLESDNSDFYYTKAEILLDLEKPKEALRCINRCIKLGDEDHDEEGEQQTPSSFMVKSDVYHDLGKYKTAIDYDLKAIQIFKKQKIIKDEQEKTLAEAFYGIGHHYLHLKKYGQSLKWLQKAEKQKPYDDTGQIAFDKADVLLNLKRYDEAGKAAQKAVYYDVENGEYWLMLCYCLVMAKKNSLNVLRALNFSYYLMPEPSSERKRWSKEIKTITRYLKNADEDEIAKSVIKLKKKWQQLNIFYPKGPKDWGRPPVKK